jgi:flagellar biosynthesis protein FliQ
MLFTIKDIDRVIAILDQHNIKGNLGTSDLAESVTISKKIVIYSLIFGIIVSALQYTGVMIEINRYLFR